VQRLHRGLPLSGIVFCLRQLGDVERGVAKRRERASVGQRDWFVEFPGPAHGALYTNATSRPIHSD
jgi:hypothetical protein